MTVPTEAFAIIRLDLFLADQAVPEACVTIKGLVTTPEDAESEVLRLNGLVTDGQVLYTWQRARWIGEAGRTQTDT